MQTLAGAFLVFRRGFVLACLGLNVGAVAIVNHPFPLAFLPFTLGLAYLIIYFIHVKGVLKLFPENGKKQTAAKSE